LGGHDVPAPCSITWFNPFTVIIQKRKLRLKKIEAHSWAGAEEQASLEGKKATPRPLSFNPGHTWAGLQGYLALCNAHRLLLSQK
jgi:hypothetical protein